MRESRKSTSLTIKLYGVRKGDCKVCRLPLKGGVTGKNYCICNDVEAMTRCMEAVSMYCADCQEVIETKEDEITSLARYLQRGNYCTRCTSKSSTPEYDRRKTKSGLDYKDYIRQARKRGERITYRLNGI